MFCLQEMHLKYKNAQRLKWKGQKHVNHEDAEQYRADILIADNVGKNIYLELKRTFQVMKSLIRQEDNIF